MVREFMLSIVPSYKEQFLRLCRSCWFVCTYVYVVNTLMTVYLFFKINVAKFSFLLDECNS